MSESKHKPMKRDKLSVNTAKCGNIEIVVTIPCHPDDAIDRDVREHYERFTDRICDCYNACTGLADPAAELTRLRAVEEAADTMREWAREHLKPPTHQANLSHNRQRFLDSLAAYDAAKQPPAKGEEGQVTDERAALLIAVVIDGKPNAGPLTITCHDFQWLSDRFGDIGHIVQSRMAREIQNEITRDIFAKCFPTPERTTPDE
jgi:hypothetical protein